MNILKIYESNKLNQTKSRNYLNLKNNKIKEENHKIS